MLAFTLAILAEFHLGHAALNQDFRPIVQVFALCALHPNILTSF